MESIHFKEAIKLIEYFKYMYRDIDDVCTQKSIGLKQLSRYRSKYIVPPACSNWSFIFKGE